VTTGFLGFDPDRLDALLRLLDEVGSEAERWRSSEPAGQIAVRHLRTGVANLLELRREIRRVLASGVLQRTFPVALLPPVPGLALPRRWLVATTAPRTPTDLVTRAEVLLVELLARVSPSGLRTSWRDLVEPLRSIAAGDDDAATALIAGLGPDGLAFVLERLHAADLPGADHLPDGGTRSVAQAVAVLLGRHLSRPGVDPAPWEAALAALPGHALARVVSSAELPDATLARLTRSLFERPPAPGAVVGGEGPTDIDRAAAALARRPTAAREVLASLDAEARWRLLAEPTHGGIPALLRTLADRGPSAAPAVARALPQWIDTVRAAPVAPREDNRAALGDVFGAWIDELVGSTVGVGGWPARSSAELQDALTLVARSAEGARSLTAWLTAVTLDVTLRGIAGGGAVTPQWASALRLVGLAAEHVTSAVVAGRNAWATARAEERATLVWLIEEVVAHPIHAVTAPARAVPGVSMAVAWLGDRTVEWVSSRLAEGLGAAPVDEPVLVRAAVEIEREVAHLLLVSVVLAAAGAPAALRAAVRTAPTRAEVTAIAHRWRDDRSAIRALDALDHYLAGWASCDRRICR
jgi:hypothetical protein